MKHYLLNSIIRKFVDLILESDEDIDWEIYELMNEILIETICNYKENIRGKQSWTKIPLELYRRILEDYSKFQEVRPQFYKFIDKFIGIITRNILKIKANTELAGHDLYFPIDEVKDCGLTEEDFEDFGDYISDENGQMRISDYALQPLLQKLSELRNISSYEEKLLKIEQILSVIHMRSDIASWFIEGGSNSLSSLSGYKRDEKETLKFMNIIDDLYSKLKNVEGFLPEKNRGIYINLQNIRKELNNNPVDHNITNYDIEVIKNKIETILKKIYNTEEYKNFFNKLMKLNNLLKQVNNSDEFLQKNRLKKEIQNLIRYLKQQPKDNNITNEVIEKIEKQFEQKSKKIVSEALKKKKLGSLNVDSGQALFIDPVYLKNIKRFIKKIDNKELIKTGKNGASTVGQGVFFQQFGGDGKYDVYGLYDTKADNSYIPFEIIIKIRDDKLKEGTSSFLPGFSDDTTSDILYNINLKISKIINTELNKIINKYNSTKRTKNEQFFDKWRFANIITTALQRGFFIEKRLIEKAIKNYNDVYQDINKDKYLAKSLKQFNTEIQLVLNSLKKEKVIKTKNKKLYFYSPDFLKK